MTGVLIRSGEDRETRRKNHVKMEAELGVTLPQPSSWNHHKLEGARKDFPLRALERRVALLTSWFHTCGLQNWERRCFCSLCHHCVVTCHGRGRKFMGGNYVISFASYSRW